MSTRAVGSQPNRIVLDTSVLISAYLYRGLPRQILELARRGEVRLIVSRDTVEELARVLGYEKFGLATGEIKEILTDLRTFAEYFEVRERVSIILDDPTDNIFLSLAREGGASRIVSGDRHLLALGDFEGIAIVSVRAFLEEMGKV